MKGAGPGSRRRWTCSDERSSAIRVTVGPAHCHQVLAIIGWTKDPAANRREDIDLAQRALRFAKDDADVLGRAAFAFAYFGEDLDTAIALVDHARELNPNFALRWFRSG